MLVRLAFSIGYAIAFLWGVNGIASGAITFGTMTAFLQLVGQVQRPLMDMARLLPGFITATASSKRLMELEKKRRQRMFLPLNWQEVSVLKLIIFLLPIQIVLILF